VPSVDFIARIEPEVPILDFKRRERQMVCRTHSLLGLPSLRLGIESKQTLWGYVQAREDRLSGGVQFERWSVVVRKHKVIEPGLSLLDVRRSSLLRKCVVALL
jgi:hypothetical protein